MLDTMFSRPPNPKSAEFDVVCIWFFLFHSNVKGLSVKKFVPTFLGLFLLSVFVLPVVGCSGGGGGDASAESASEDLSADEDLAADGDDIGEQANP